MATKISFEFSGTLAELIAELGSTFGASAFQVSAKVELRPPEPAAPVKPMRNVAFIYHRDEFDAFHANGQKIAAIKLMRELTGCRLKDAKDYLESLNCYPDWRRPA